MAITSIESLVSCKEFIFVSGIVSCLYLEVMQFAMLLDGGNVVWWHCGNVVWWHCGK